MLFEQALILAENENDAHCVGAERVVVIERLRDIHGKTAREARHSNTSQGPAAANPPRPCGTRRDQGTIGHPIALTSSSGWSARARGLLPQSSLGPRFGCWLRDQTLTPQAACSLPRYPRTHSLSFRHGRLLLESSRSVCSATAFSHAFRAEPNG